MRKILYGLMSVSALAFVAFAGSTAFFSSEVTSNNNIFRSGTVNLRVGSSYETDYNGAGGRNLGSGTSAMFNLQDLKPGDTGVIEGQVQVIDNDAWVCGSAELTQGTSTQLAQEIQVRLWKADPTAGTPTPLNVWAGPTSLANYTLSGWQSLNDSTTVPNPLLEPEGTTVAGSLAGMQASDDPALFFLEYCFGTFGSSTAGDCVAAQGVNAAQDQIVRASLGFYAVQARNNADFLCGDLNGPEITTTSFTGWPTVADQATQRWQAEGRYGDAGGVQTWEYGVGTNTGNSATADTSGQFAWPNNTPVPFSVSFDGTEATFSLDGNTPVVHSVPGGSDLYFVARGTSGVGTVTLDNLVVDGNPLTETVVSTDGPESLKVEGLDLTQPFTASGNVTFDWSTTPSNSNMAFQVVVANPPTP